MPTTTQVQLRRGTNSQIATGIGAFCEVWASTDDFHLYVQDAVSQGGWKIPLIGDLPTNYVSSGLLQSTGQTLYTYITNTSGILNTTTNTLNSNLQSTGIYLYNLINNTTPSLANVVFQSGIQVISGQKTISGANFYVWGNVNNTLPLFSVGTTLKNYLQISNGHNYTFNSSGYLIDNSNITGLNWDARMAYDALGTGSIDWNGRILLSTGGAQSINWNANQLYNNLNPPFPTLALDWQNQQLTGKWYHQSGHFTESIKLTPSIQTNTVFLGNNPFYIYTGNSSGIFVLPPINQNTGKIFFVKNKGQNGFLSGQGSDMLFDYAPNKTSPFNSGDGYILACDGYHWAVM